MCLDTSYEPTKIRKEMREKSLPTLRTWKHTYIGLIITNVNPETDSIIHILGARSLHVSFHNGGRVVDAVWADIFRTCLVRPVFNIQTFSLIII